MGVNQTPDPEPTPALEPVGTATSGTIVADARRPYKAIAAFVLTVLGTFWAAVQAAGDVTSLDLMGWLSIIIPTLLTTGAVYGVSNPITYKVDRS